MADPYYARDSCEPKVIDRGNDDSGRSSLEDAQKTQDERVKYDHKTKSGDHRGNRQGRERDDIDSTYQRDPQHAKSPQDDKYSSQYRDYEHGGSTPEVVHAKGRHHGHSGVDSSGRKRHRSRERDSDKSRHSRDRERKSFREDSDRDDFEHRTKRRSRSRDRERSRRHRDSDRRHRDHDRERHRDRRERERDRDDKERSPKEVPWVPPPLPEHLRHIQVEKALNAGEGHEKPRKPPPIAIPFPVVQNQFQNDGSFFEMFRQQMQAAKSNEKSEDSNSNDAQASTVSVTHADVTPSAAAPPLAATSSGLPVIAKRRISKILKTGVVKKPKKEEEVSEEKDGDGWSSYMKEVQRYRANKCIENEASRPPLVK